jgi:hypothetical protein
MLKPNELAKEQECWRLIDADDDELPALERDMQFTQVQAVDELIERSYWSVDLPHLMGGRGTHADRLRALRAAYRNAHSLRPSHRGH